jgi:SAM-dependent methyltransferase
LTEALHSHSHGLQITGLDISSHALALAAGLNPSAHFFVGSAEALPFADETFDLVLCTEVLEHLPQPHLALKEMQRVTRDCLVASVPHEPWFSLMNLLRGRDIMRGGNHPEHLHCWTEKRFKHLLGQWFAVEQVALSFPWTLVLARRQR